MRCFKQESDAVQDSRGLSVAAGWRMEGQIGVWGAGRLGERVEMLARRQWLHVGLKARGQVQANLGGAIGKLWPWVGPGEERE